MRLGWRMVVTLGVIGLSSCLMVAIDVQADWPELSFWRGWILEWHGVLMGLLFVWCWGWFRGQRLPGEKTKTETKDAEK